MASTTNGQRITRDDLEGAFAGALGDVEDTARAAVPQAVVVAVAVAVTVLALAYFAGRRRGRAKSAVVEIRRL